MPQSAAFRRQKAIAFLSRSLPRHYIAELWYNERERMRDKMTAWVSFFKTAPEGPFLRCVCAGKLEEEALNKRLARRFCSSQMQNLFLIRALCRPLNLRHGWAGGRDTFGKVAARREGGENAGSSESGESEPQECSNGLTLVAAHRLVGSAVGDGVGVEVRDVAAGVDTELGSEGNTTAEVEESHEEVNCDQDDRVNRKLLLESGRYQVDERDHCYDGHEDRVVDNGRISACRVGDHVTGNGQDEESPEELEATEAEIDVLRNHFDGWSSSTTGKGSW